MSADVHTWHDGERVCRENLLLVSRGETRLNEKGVRGDLGESTLRSHRKHSVRSFRTADACKALKAIADENDLSKTTLQHIKGVLGGIFILAKNEGAFDGANPVQEARIPSNAREPAET